MTRTLTDLEFSAVWERYTGERLPTPFTFMSRTPCREDYEREVHQVWQQLRADGFLAQMVQTLHLPDVYVAVDGWDPADWENPAGRIRVHAARAGSSAYVVTQLPGETIWHSGGFTIADIQPRGIAAAIVAALPETPPGQWGNVTIVEGPEPDSSFHQTRSIVADEGDASLERSTRFLGAPTTSIGMITVCQGRSKFGPRGMGSRALGWRDLSDDGRYVIPVGVNPVAAGVKARRLIEMIDEAIGEMVERLETHWEAGDSDSLRERNRSASAGW
ncbi:ESX secretion-associated protein EspG [Nocardia sp. NPDC052566]|uniref:ESX secretion-associated protein EspG n=1 Tax=Nocardia sp. NPDC052566 TaxID=3364330 RepID=UPI0037C53D6F